MNYHARTPRRSQVVMLLSRMIMPLTVCLLVALGALSFAQEQPPADSSSDKITVPLTAAPRETRSYKVNVDVKGKLLVEDSDQPVDLDALYALKIAHKYGRREPDGFLPLEISVIEADLTANGQKLSVTPTAFPKLTLLLGRDWQTREFFGIAGTRYAVRTPGINYANLFILFYPYGADKPRAIGETWQEKVKLAGLDETYQIALTLKSVEKIDGVEAAVVREEITWLPAEPAGSVVTTTRAAAESFFALANGKLLKSHAECEVRFAKKDAGGQEQAASRANIKVDIALAK